MQIFWNDDQLPKGVQAHIARTRGEDVGRITIRGGRELAAYFEEQETGILELRGDDGTAVAKAQVTIETVSLYAVAGSPDADAAAEIYGSATGAMPNGGLYA